MNIPKKWFLVIVVIIPFTSFGVENEEKTWDSETYNKHSSSQEMSAMELLSRVSISKNADLLDLACGTGNISAKLAEMVPDGTVLGIDISKDNIDLATKKTLGRDNLFFEQGRAQDLENKEHFDAIIFTAALQYIPVTEQLDVLQRIFRALKPGGILLLRTPLRIIDAPHQAAILETIKKPEWQLKLAGSDDSRAIGLIMKQVNEAVNNTRTHEELQSLIDEAGFEGEVSIYNHAHPMESKKALMGYFQGPLSGYPFFARMSKDDQTNCIEEITDLYMEKMEMTENNLEYRIPLLTVIVTKSFK